MKQKSIDYCILYREDKGYYLSKTTIAQSLNFKIVDQGEKSYCEKKIGLLNNPEALETKH